MMIIQAINYGFRTVLGVCLNPSAPEWVHNVGEALRGPNGVVLGVRRVTSTATLDGCGGDSCHNCHYNWRVIEVIFDGDQQLTVGDDGCPRRKTVEEFAAEAFTQAAPAPASEILTALIGQEF